jgi:hypothetical protein
MCPKSKSPTGFGQLLLPFHVVLYEGYNTKISKPIYKYQNIQNAFQGVDTSNSTWIFLTHVPLAQIILSVIYILTYFNTMYWKRNISYMHICFDAFVIYPSYNNSQRMATKGGRKM